jgi:hypothetical protein
MVEITEVAIAMMLEYVSLSVSSAVGYTTFKASITGCVYFFNSRKAKSLMSSAIMSPLENGPTTWKGDQIAIHPLRKSRAYTAVNDQCLLTRTESNLASGES